MFSRNVMERQTFSLKKPEIEAAERISTMGADNPDGVMLRSGSDWIRHHVCRHDKFSVVVLESYRASADEIGYTNQEDYIKINIWLNGKHTTVLDGFGQREHDCPEVFVTCGPQETVKVDILNRGTQTAVVALCLLRDFFPVHMGMYPDDLPEPLRALVRPKERPYAFCRFPLTQDLAAAARAILAAPFALRGDPRYGQAKCMELMCLLINLMDRQSRTEGAGTKGRARHESRLYEARDLLNRHYAEPITLERLCKEVGLNRMALTSGFRRLFSMSVYDYLQKERMERGFELLQDQDYTVTRVAEEVGFGHSCNFSTAFRAYFGCTPQQVRLGMRR